MAKTEKVRVQVLFSEDTDKGRFQDALYYTEDDWAATNQAVVDAEKKSRKDNWYAVVTAPSPELTEAEQAAQLQERIDAITAEKTDLEAQKAKLVR